MGRSEGIEDFSVRVLQGLRMEDFSKPFAIAARRSPTLKTALDKFRELAHLEDNFISFWIMAAGTTAKLHIVNGFPIEPQDLQYEDWNEIMALIAIVRTFAGQTWVPEEIGFRADVSPGRFASGQFPCTRFVPGQDTAYITVPLELLSRPPLVQAVPMDAGDAPDREPGTHAESAQGFPASLKRVLAPYLGDGYPEVHLAAELAGTSVRTLQRRLRQHNTSYSELIQQTRFAIASKLLRDTDERIVDIALDLGYQDPANFARAFRQLTGVSPSEYRRQHCRH
jgi:AraC-like DNA-binding protein